MHLHDGGNKDNFRKRPENMAAKYMQITGTGMTQKAQRIGYEWTIWNLIPGR
jgi:hypothetical protein